MSNTSGRRISLLSSQARVQAPWIKVTIGTYTFGVFSKSESNIKNEAGFYKAYNIQYPNFINGLSITKINGQVNKYNLSILYPVRAGDDPNFFEKVFSSVSGTRKIVFSYGDSAMPTYCYKDEEAIITKVTSGFGFGSGGSSSAVISYNVEAISGAALGLAGSFTFTNTGKKKPSDEIKRLFRNSKYGLRNIFTGMSEKNLDALIDGSDKAVELKTKTNISTLDYIKYLVGCMIPAGSTETDISKDIYILTLHDDTTYDKLYNDTISLGGPYFKVTRTSYNQSYSDAYEVDIGINTATLVTNFSINHNENYSILYDYNRELQPDTYIRRINDQGEWEDVFSPAFTSRNPYRETAAEDVSWYTKITKYPITASITIQGLLRPAILMSYLRLNVILPGGMRHISSGLYIVTAQRDEINSNGYRTTLTLTRIDSDDSLQISNDNSLGLGNNAANTNYNNYLNQGQVSGVNRSGTDHKIIQGVYDQALKNNLVKK